MEREAPLVGILMGSESDLPLMRECGGVFKQFDIPYEMDIISAHRTPSLAREYASTAYKRGIKVIIAGAGGAAHLAGVIASETILPVIGVPLDSTSIGGLDALLSTVQMPSGVPVATVAIGKSGAKNAAILAVQILAIFNSSLSKKLLKFKTDLALKVKQKSKTEG